MILIYLDVLHCPTCGYQKSSATSFLDIPVNLLTTPESHIDLNNVTLSQLLKHHLTPESLDTDNMWECGKCNKKVPAMKSVIYDTLPNILTIHLKRFHYDQVTIIFIIFIFIFNSTFIIFCYCY